MKSVFSHVHLNACQVVCLRPRVPARVKSVELVPCAPVIRPVPLDGVQLLVHGGVELALELHGGAEINKLRHMEVRDFQGVRASDS